MDGGGGRELRVAIAVGDAAGCAFIIDEESAIRRLKPRTYCGALRRPGSPYCRRHHVLCHVPGGSSGEVRRLRETEALATAVGGTRGDPAERIPPDRFLRWLEQIARAFSRAECSRIVPERRP